MPLRYNESRIARAVMQDCLERIENIPMSNTPSINDLQILYRGDVITNMISSARYARP